jgi:hypothetical protein
MGWSGTKNGRLLALCSARFECLLTVDRNMAFQQDVQSLPVAVLVIDCRRNQLSALIPILPAVHRALAQLAPCKITHVGDADASPTPEGVSEWTAQGLGHVLPTAAPCTPPACYVA